MTEAQFDLIVIGTGPGGEGAAMQAVKHGKNVAVIERCDLIGGNCTHRGTIPSKALRFAINQLTEASHNALLREAGVSVRFSIPELRRSARSVIDRQVDMRRGFYDRNRVQVTLGEARFVDAHTVEVDRPEGAKARLTAAAFVIATGARPYHPPDVDFDHPRIFDSDTILDLHHTPQSITIYGAGVVGCEYTSMFRNLECKVNLVNTRGKLLEFLDDEIIDALSYHMRDRGVLLRHNETYERVEGRDDGVVLYLKSGKQLKTDVLLWANGRTGNSDNMGLDKIGVQPDSRGTIQVNFQTSQPHIYAVGDVIGFPSLASAAYVQGRVAASHFVFGQGDHALVRDIPTGIYTTPEISSLGKTERELTEANVPYEIGHALFKNLARAQITGQTVGMLKLLFHRETLELLGIHCFGANASEIIHIGQAIMSQQGKANTLLYFINTTFNYPTMAEAYRVAALNGYNRLFQHAIVMKFGDRISGQHVRVLEERTKQYFDHLTRNGFEVSGDLFRYFAGEVFHDSEIKILSLSSAGSVVLQMRNIFAIDRFNWNVRPGVRNRRLSVKLFSTRVSFHEVSRFVWSPFEPQVYYCAELDRLANGRLRLDIFCPTPRGIRRTIRIECTRIAVEDILPRIKSMLPKRELAKIVLWPSDSDFHQSTLARTRGK